MKGQSFYTLEFKEVCRNIPSFELNINVSHTTPLAGFRYFFFKNIPMNLLHWFGRSDLFKTHMKSPIKAQRIIVILYLKFRLVYDPYEINYQNTKNDCKCVPVRLLAISNV